MRKEAWMAKLSHSERKVKNCAAQKSVLRHNRGAVGITQYRSEMRRLVAASSRVTALVAEPFRPCGRIALPDPCSAAWGVEPMDTRPGGTLLGVALLGWMERDHALRFLTEECVLPAGTSDQSCEAMWTEARARAASLPERPDRAPEEYPLTAAEQGHARRFLQWMEGIGMPGLRVIKIDPLELVVGQYWVALDRASEYVQKSQSADVWARTALPIAPRPPSLEMKFTRRNLDTDIHIDLPHSEFLFGVHMDTAQYDGAAPSSGPRGGFGPKELLGHVSVLRAGRRLLLGKGYHRVYARIAATDATLPARLSLVALEMASMQPPPQSPNGHSLPNGPTASAAFDIFGSRPALMADFFTPAMTTPVCLRRKRYQLRVESRWIAINAE